MKNLKKQPNNMKKTILTILAVAALVSCKKSNVQPTSTGTVPIVNEFYYRVAGNPDTNIIYLNGSPVLDNILPGERHTITINKGDVLTIYSSSPTDSAGGFNFAIWNAGNFLPDQTIRYTYPKQPDTTVQRFYVRGSYSY